MVKMNTKRILVVRVYATSQGDDQTGRVCQINNGFSPKTVFRPIFNEIFLTEWGRS